MIFLLQSQGETADRPEAELVATASRRGAYGAFPLIAKAVLWWRVYSCGDVVSRETDEYNGVQRQMFGR
jgi:hypothetical protein